MKNQSNIFLWIPNIFGFKGGIQVYSRFFVNALNYINPESKYSVFLMHDTSCPNNISDWKNTRFYLAGKWHKIFRKIVYFTHALSHGLCRRPNLIITTHLNFTVIAYLLKRLVNIPYWTVAHGIEAWDIQNPRLKTALHHADRILAVSNYTRNRLIEEQNLDPNKVSILPNTFDSSRFHIAPKPEYLLQEYKLKPSQPVILTVARLAETEQYKGYNQIIKALPHIREHIPDIHYILVGKGNDKPRIEQLIAQLEIQDNVTLAGFIPDEQLCDYYNLCDVFAMPSKKEGFGIVYLEALACGKPVLAGNQDGSVDAVCNGELGALVNPDNTQEIAQTLIQILKGTYSNPLIYQPEALREKVIETFRFERFQQTLASHLHEHFQLRG